MGQLRRFKHKARQHWVNFEIILEEIDDDLPAQVKSVVALRNTANLNNQCPVCFAAAEYAGFAEYGNHIVVEMRFAHQPECAASDDGLHKLIEQYGNGR